jgi:hypothetical protein
MVRGLRYDFRDPERYYEIRSEIAGALMRLSRRLTGRAMPAPMPPPLRRPMPAVRAIPAAAPPVPKLSAPQVSRRQDTLPRPRRTTSRRHRYPMPPADAQARML